MERKLFSKFLLIAFFALCSCGQQAEASSSSVYSNPIKALSLAHAPTKANYQEGEYFSRSGVIVEALFEDGTRKAVHGYELSPSGPLSSNVEEMVATYEGYEISIPISVSTKTSGDSSFPAQVNVVDDEEMRYRVEAENAYYKTPLSSSQLKDHSTRNKETSNLGSVGEFALNNPMQIAIDCEVEASVDIVFSLAYNTSTSIDANYDVVWNGENLVTNIVVEAGSDPFPYYTWKEYTVPGLFLQKGRNTLIFGVKSSSSAKINVDYVDFAVSPFDGGSSSQEKETGDFLWGALNEDYQEEIIGSPSTFVAPLETPHPENDIHSDSQYRYLSSGYDTISRFASGNREASKPEGLRMNFDYLEGEEGPFYIEVSTEPSFKESEVFESEETTFYYPNPLLDQNYYYRVDTSLETLSLQQPEIAYSLALGPRNLDIDGITNVRDLGGYPSKLGGLVRQGLYYRGGRLNKSEQNNLEFDITEKGIEEFSSRLGIKTEIDLRMNDSGKFPSHSNEYGFMKDGEIEGVSYINCPLDLTRTDMMKESKPMIGEIFHLLSDENNYPVYLHCNIGTDRTGMISYLLGCLLGIPQEDLYRDYLYSNFGNIGGSRGIGNIAGKYQSDLLSVGEKNIYWDARSYLNSCGVEDEELDKIVDMFIDFDAI